MYRYIAIATAILMFFLILFAVSRCEDREPPVSVTPNPIDVPEETVEATEPEQAEPEPELPDTR